MGYYKKKYCRIGYEKLETKTRQLLAKFLHLGSTGHILFTVETSSIIRALLRRGLIEKGINKYSYKITIEGALTLAAYYKEELQFYYQEEML